MAKRDKLFDKIMSKPPGKDVTFKEVQAFLQGQGYKKIEGKGSRVKFYNEATNDLINFHKPHPEKELKIYQVELIQKHIEEQL